MRVNKNIIKYRDASFPAIAGIPAFSNFPQFFFGALCFIFPEKNKKINFSGTPYFIWPENIYLL